MPTRYICNSGFIVVYKTAFPAGVDDKHGDIRLVGGNYLWEGRVEIFLSGAWGTVCDDGAHYVGPAMMVCRQLGYHTESEAYEVIMRHLC